MKRKQEEKHKVIGLDLDGVVYDFETPFSEWLKMNNGSDLVRPDKYNLEERYDLIDSKEESKSLLCRFAQHRPFLWIPEYEESINLIKKLSRSNQIYYITDRNWHKQNAEDTFLRLKDDGLLDRNQCIIFSGNKGDEARKRKLDYLVEDNLENVIDTMGKSLSTQPILMDRDYNRKNRPSSVPTVKNWRELFNYLVDEIWLND